MFSLHFFFSSQPFETSICGALVGQSRFAGKKPNWTWSFFFFLNYLYVFFINNRYRYLLRPKAFFTRFSDYRSVNFCIVRRVHKPGVCLFVCSSKETERRMKRTPLSLPVVALFCLRPQSVVWRIKKNRNVQKKHKNKLS